jgi:hypothetical protein
LSCITSRKPCLNLYDLIPNAWIQEVREEGPYTQPPQHCSDIPIKLFAREATNIVAVQVLSATQLPRSNDTYLDQSASVLVLSRLKNALSIAPGSTQQIESGAPYFISPPAVPPSQLRFSIGEKYILLIDASQ